MLFSSEVPPPTAEHEQTLHRQSITQDEPGPILRDAETMLDFIGEDGLRVSATKHYIYTKRLPELNARLSRPLDVEYQRPQQKNYPYIHGLYLLLRADEEAIFGDRFDPLGNLNRALRLFEDIPDGGLTPSSEDWSDLRYPQPGASGDGLSPRRPRLQGIAGPEVLATPRCAGPSATGCAE